MEDTDRGLHPAVDGQSLGERWKVKGWSVCKYWGESVKIRIAKLNGMIHLEKLEWPVWQKMEDRWAEWNWVTNFSLGGTISNSAYLKWLIVEQT